MDNPTIEEINEMVSQPGAWKPILVRIFLPITDNSQLQRPHSPDFLYICPLSYLVIERNLIIRKQKVIAIAPLSVRNYILGILLKVSGSIQVHFVGKITLRYAFNLHKMTVYNINEILIVKNNCLLIFYKIQWLYFQKNSVRELDSSM